MSRLVSKRLEGRAWQAYTDKLAIASAATKTVKIQKRIREAKPQGRGFGKPRKWVQTLFTEGNHTGLEDHYQGFNGTDEAIAALACALVQLHFVDAVLVIDGTADLSDVKLCEIDEYTTRAVDDAQRVIQAYEI